MVELLVTLAVTVIGLAGLVAIHGSGIKANRVSRESAGAIEVGERIMEDLRGIPADQIAPRFDPDGTLPVDVQLGTVTGGPVPYAVRLIAEEIPADTDLVRIRIEVNWTELGAAPGAEGGRYDHRIVLEMVRTKLEQL